MRSLARSLQKENVVGDEIPLPWFRLDRDLQIHTKELVLVAGAPGAGKSVFALNLAMGAESPVLYFAQDSAPSVVARMAALELGDKISNVYDALRHEEERIDLSLRLADTRPGLAVVTGAKTVDEIRAYIEAHTEFLGIAPPIVIIDNLIDTLVEGSHHQEVGFYAKTLNAFKQMAQELNVCIIALHHVTRRGGEGRNQNPHGLGTRSLKMTDLLYSGEREAEHVIGIYHNIQQTEIFVQILKQRDGIADAEGGTETGLRWHPSRGLLTNR